MEVIALVSYAITGVLTCVALFFGHLASKQLNADNSIDDEPYEKYKKYSKLMMGTYGIMFLGVIVLAIYVFLIR